MTSRRPAVAVVVLVAGMAAALGMAVLGADTCDEVMVTLSVPERIWYDAAYVYGTGVEWLEGRYDFQGLSAPEGEPNAYPAFAKSESTADLEVKCFIAHCESGSGEGSWLLWGEYVDRSTPDATVEARVEFKNTTDSDTSPSTGWQLVSCERDGLPETTCPTSMPRIRGGAVTSGSDHVAPAGRYGYLDRSWCGVGQLPLSDDLDVSVSAVYWCGEPVTGAFAIEDAFGERSTDPMARALLYRVVGTGENATRLPAGSHESVEFDADRVAYAFSVDTDTLSPGMYDIELAFSVGSLYGASFTDWVRFVLESDDVEDCDDGFDNDGDMLIDCEDPDCVLDIDGDGHVVRPCGDDCDDGDWTWWCTTFYADADNDHWGDEDKPNCLCAWEDGVCSQSGDCDDDDWWRNPDRPEFCDYIDNDCDFQTDEDFDLTSDLMNCGECGNECTDNGGRAIPQCVDGDCTYECETCVRRMSIEDCDLLGMLQSMGCPVPTLCCASAFLDCSGNDGLPCETEIWWDAANCGSCGHVCPPSQPYCAYGVCRSAEELLEVCRRGALIPDCVDCSFTPPPPP